mmetsp:Transcript_28866/g.93042  ORF Transcript_28866/g.93042 Transcript_28866/m.93042 type:complete len:467 (+) Transcript_28866:1317-2717(+)
MDTATLESLRAQLGAEGQLHVLEWVDDLTVKEARLLAAQLASLDIGAARATWSQAVASSSSESAASGTTLCPLPSTASSSESASGSWRRLGLELVASGGAAALVLAGGQGTRLGYDGPKGCFEVVEDMSLFELFAKRLKTLGEIAGGGVPPPRFLVMTSASNHEATENFFKRRDYFGLDAQRVHIFPQGTMPAVDLAASDRGEFKLHMESRYSVATAPDGNGGVYGALKRAGLLELLFREKISYVHVWSVDNALSLPCDPTFLGYCLTHKAEVASKVVPKSEPNEKVGVLALKDGKPAVVEYTELSAEDAAKRDADGRLTFRSGNICNHALTPAFLAKAADARLPYHVARKAVASPTSGEVTVTKPNAIKMETFIFDAFTLSPDHVTLEVRRETDFAPVKNKDGADSPLSARTALLQQGAAWLRAAGATVLGSDGAFVPPFVSYAGEGLEAYKGQTLDATQGPLVL